MTSNRQVITFALMLSITMMSISAYPAMETDDVWRLIRTIRHPQELPAVVPQHRNLHQQYEYGQPQARAKSEASDYADYNDLMLLLDDTRDAVDGFDLKKALLSRQLGRGLSAPFFAASSRNPVWVPEDVPAEYDSGAGVWYDQVAQDGSESEDSEGVKSSLTEMLNNLAENRNENAEHKRSERGREVSTASTATVTTTAIPEAGQKEVAMMRPASPSRLSQHNAKMAATSDGGNRKRKMAATGSSSVISYQDDLTEELDNLKRTMN